jgi:hypothetical protein
MSTRQSIVDDIKARMETITETNGYSYGLYGNVSVWRLTDIQDHEQYWIDIRDIKAEETDRDNVSSYKDLTVELRIFAQNNDGTADDLRALLVDVFTAIETDLCWSENAYDTRFVSNEMTLEQGKQIAGLLLVTIVIRYETKIWED